MALAPGTRIGNYDVLSSLGAGGMGEVYRARDGRLGRDVALKVLPADFASDPERRRRFEQEARAASGLNHPNVVHVYDVGAENGTVFIAMELVEGRTLREIASPGPLPLKRFLDVAIQLADGLARAHEAGIVHRDLKPENVMVSKDGHIRILDFGLAKLVEPEGQPGDLTTSPELTRAGMVVGTVGYMSPEQAAGRRVDFRSDQFSLGTMLYELASGKRPFQRETGAETLTAILREAPPPLATVAPSLPPPLRWIIDERCLGKDPEDRYASTRDLVRELQSVRDHMSDVSAVITSAKPSRRWTWAIPILTLLAGVAAGAWLDARLGSPPATEIKPTLRRISFRRGAITNARFAPDGQTIVYSAVFGSDPARIYSTRVDSPESRLLDLPEGGVFAVASTGDMAISVGQRETQGWERSGTLARVPLGGGAPRMILENIAEADWSPDGRQLAIIRDSGGMRRLEYPAGKELYATAGYISHIRVSPAGDRVAFLDHPVRGDNAGFAAIVDASGRKQRLGPEFLASEGLAWSPSGTEIWFAGGVGAGSKNDLWAVTLGGRERLLWREAGAVSLRDVSKDGRVILGRQNASREIFGVGPDGANERELTWLDWSFPIDLSDDGKTLLFEEQGEGAGETYAIYVRGTDGSPAIRLGDGRALALSPDGKSVLGLIGDKLQILPIGAGITRALPLGSLTCQVVIFVPDGKRLLLAANEPGKAGRLYVMDIAGGAPRPFSEEGVSMTLGNSTRRVSPDGEWVAAIGPDGQERLYPIAGGAPRPIPGLAPEEQMIRWTSDGKSLYVYRPQIHARIEVLEIATGRRRLWKELAPADPAGVVAIRSVLVAPDGRSYVYSYTRQTEDLYLADGVK